MLKSVQSKRKCFTEKGSWQGIHRGQSPPFSKKECVIKGWPILSRAKVTSSLRSNFLVEEKLSLTVLTKSVAVIFFAEKL